MKKWLLWCCIFGAGLVWAEESRLEEFQKCGLPDEILFAVRKPSIDGHWYANIGYYATSSCRYPFHPHGGGKLCIYNVKTKQTRTLFEDPQGSVRDPQLHYDGQKILFAYLPAGKYHYSLYEIDIDGKNLRQLTGKGEDTQPAGQEDLTKYAPAGWDDFEPTYLPDGQIVFCSTRCKRYVQCWKTHVATLYKCNADGSNIRQLSANLEHDNTPWVLANGQIIYMRWEYIDRNHLVYHHLWSMNPDGTRQMVFYGNQRPGGVFLGAKPIPGTPAVVATFSPGHGMKEHYGKIAIFDPSWGPDDPRGVKILSKTTDHSDPWPFDTEHFLVSARTQLMLLDGKGNTEVIYELPPEDVKKGYWLSEARPVMKRQREPEIADLTDPASDHGTLALINVYHGRKMSDVKKGTIKYLQIYEALPKPVNYAGGMSEMSSAGTFAAERLIGTVPVSEDGSAYFNLPPLRSVLFLCMDENHHCVKRMHSFTSVMPGEVTVCIGCHEERLETPSAEEKDQLARLMRTPPVDPQPIEGVPDIFDFPRDIQPILDKHCLECHNHDREEGGFNISGDWGPLYTIGYQQLSWRKLLGDNRITVPYRPKSNFGPYEIGTGASRLLQLMEEHHEGVKLSEAELKMVRCWLDAGANYAATFTCNCAGEIGSYESVNMRNDKDWPETKAMAETISRRCDPCHAPTEADKKIGSYTLPAQYYANYYPPEQFQKNLFVAHTLSEDGGRFNRHIIFNLSYPEKSKAVRAPLAQSAGGLGVCQAKSGKPVFTDTNDPDYQTILAGIQRGRKYILEENNRFSMALPSPNNGKDCPVRFVPRKEYVREMIRYGILPSDWDFSQPLNPYEVERKYWESMWYKPVRK
ncbi:MAG: hypothetical protein Q4D98_02805 [Planctomycetia bacterium]|nr:hypothetical protein [Planctomycetia bacterium]